ncbi:MAG TPA: citrate synthase [Sphingomicrobium sp.]|nr:citrate synthase [Sphingomicrobium sp.]
MSVGLDDVVAAETMLSDVDGTAGRLIIRGKALSELSSHWSFEEVAALLLSEFVDRLPVGDALARAIGEARCQVFEQTRPMLERLAGLALYDGVRAGVAFMPDGEDAADALRLLAAPAVLTSALLRVRNGKPAIAPEASATHAADMLAMAGQEDVGGRLARALDAYLVTVCDHGLNASTFAARVVASTRAGLTSSVLAGMCALKGPLHGGAPGPVIKMLDAIAEEGDARAWLVREVRGGGRLMGFGHRIYRTRDPRADALKAALRRLQDLPRTSARLAFAEAVEKTALAVLRAEKPGRSLETNVEFFTALLLEAVGFPPDAFTCLFAAGRVAGWIAHAREQRVSGRLIRPQSRYIGPPADLAA